MSTSQFKKSSGITIPVWESTCPQSSFPRFSAIDKDVSTSICIVGSGIAGISTAYELHRASGKQILLLDAREIMSGETARTTGHLSSGDQGDRYYDLVDTFGEDGARKVYESHQYAVNRVGEIAKELNIDCEYRKLSAKIIKAPEEENDLKKEHDTLQSLSIPSTYSDSEKVGAQYNGPVLTIEQQGTFHPTKYLNGILEYLKKQDNVSAYTNTRYVNHKFDNDKFEITVETTDGQSHTITSDHVVLATNVSPRKFSNVIKQHYMRTYAIALSMPKDSFKDILLYDNKDPYVYVRKTTHPDSKKEYLIVGGEDHLVGIEDVDSYPSHFQNLESWARENYPQCDAVEYKWSGQVIENSEGVAYIGQSGDAEEYVVTGDNGNGLTHGVLAAKVITDLILKQSNPWKDIYDPSRKPTKAGLAGVYDFVKENVIQQKEYVRLLSVDASDIEDIPKCSGRVVRSGIKPVAVYKSSTGELTKFSAMCPHLKGVVAWNPIEQSWDCPNHGSRFSGTTGECIMGPAKKGLHPENDLAEESSQNVNTV